MCALHARPDRSTPCCADAIFGAPALADFCRWRSGRDRRAARRRISGILATGAVSGAKYNYRDAPPEILAKVERIERVCEAHGIAVPTAALHFALGHPAVASVVLGGQGPQEVERNVAALSSKVPAALWADLKAERLLDAEAPVPLSVSD